MLACAPEPALIEPSSPATWLRCDAPPFADYVKRFASADASAKRKHGCGDVARPERRAEESRDGGGEGGGEESEGGFLSSSEEEDDS
jgi:hypothetical protein